MDGAIILMMFVVFLGLGATGTPVAVALIAAGLLGGIISDVGLPTVVGELMGGVHSVPLMAVPFFMLLAELMDSSGIANIIIRFTQTIVGHIRSGLAQVNALFSIAFAGISGSAASDVAANSRVLLPAMKREGYEPAASAALIAAASTISIMIPPSVMAVIYGASAGVSVSALFLSGVFPGLAVGVGLMIFSYFFVKSDEVKARASLKQIANTGRQAIIPMLVPVLILGGILLGYFTPTEAGVVAILYTLVVAIPILARKHVPKIFRYFINGGVLTSLPLLAIAGASVFAWVFTYFGGADMVAQVVTKMAGETQVGVLFSVAIMLVVIGQFLDATPAIILFTPIILELQHMADVNPIHMGVVVVVALALGMITPPYGISLLLATSFAGVSFGAGVRKALPLYGIFAVIISGLILMPDVALWLPRLVVPEAAGCFPDPNGTGFICS